jgi:hypothetical protein
MCSKRLYIHPLSRMPETSMLPPRENLVQREGEQSSRSEQVDGSG